jgi:hypothetical protein
MRERNRLLKDQITDPGWYRALEGADGRGGRAPSPATGQARIARDHGRAGSRQRPFPPRA